MALPPPPIDIRERLEALGDELGDFMFSQEASAATLRVAERYGFSADNGKLGLFSTALGFLALQIITTEELVGEFSRLGIGSKEFSDFLNDVIKELFDPYRDAFHRVGISYEKILTAKPAGAPPITTAPPVLQPIPRPPAPPAPAPAAPPLPLTPRLPEELRAKQVAASPAPSQPPPFLPLTQPGPKAILEELGEIKKEKPEIPLTGFQPKPAPSGPLPKITMPPSPITPTAPLAEKPREELPPMPEIRYPVPPPKTQPEISGRIITPGTPLPPQPAFGQIPPKLAVPPATPLPTAPPPQAAPKVITPETKPGPEEPKKPFDAAQGKPLDETRGKEVIDLSTFQIKEGKEAVSKTEELPAEKHPPLPAPPPPKAGGNILDLSGNKQ